MEHEKLTKLSLLPPLGATALEARSCKVCGETAPAFDVVDFNKICSETMPYQFGYSGIGVWYYRCTSCEFLFTDFFDDWQKEDFERFIYNDDYIKVDGDYIEARPRRDSRFFIELLGEHKGLSVLDYGGGAGVLAEALREGGIDAECFDPFSSPARPDRLFDVITCMEVIEHSPDPVGTLKDMASFLNMGGCMMVGTGIQPADIDSIKANWWYVGPRNGHVSLQSASSLIPLARAAGLVAYRSGYLHGFTAEPSTTSKSILSSIGRPAIELMLSAPASTGSSGHHLESRIDEWHDLEEGFWHPTKINKTRWRWTAASVIHWRWTPPAGGCDVQVRIPYLMQIAEGFVPQATLTVDDRDVKLSFNRHSLMAQVTILQDVPIDIVLRLPPHLAPNSITGSDDYRRLGLAIAVYSEE